MNFELESKNTKAGTTNLGEAMTLKVRGKLRAVSSLEDLVALGDGATLIRDALAKMVRWSPELNDEQAIRVVWSKATKRFPSKPSWRVVTIADPDFSEHFVITDDGEQVKRSTLYHLPQLARVAGIFARRNEAR